MQYAQRQKLDGHKRRVYNNLTNISGGDTQRAVTYMNFEVFCFGWVGESLEVIQKEYFDTYEEALNFVNTDGEQYESVSITPMNAEAEREICKAVQK